MKIIKIVSKWKCEICEKEFDNFHAQGFDNKIYCPLCFFKEKTNRLEKENERLKDKIDKAVEHIKNIDKFEERLNDDTRIYMIQDVDVYEIERILKEN